MVGFLIPCSLSNWGTLYLPLSKSETIRFLNSSEYLRCLRILHTFAFTGFHSLSGQLISGTYKLLTSNLSYLKSRFLVLALSSLQNKKNPSLLRMKDLKKTGGDLLSRVSSTIGARGLNFCVRNGNR